MDHGPFPIGTLHTDTLVLEAKRSIDKIYYLPGGLGAQVLTDKCNLEL